MKFLSTRGGMDPQSFTQVLLGGLAPDGGLAVPESIPQLTAAQLEQWRTLTYPGLAAAVMSLYVDDIETEDLHTIVQDAYGESSLFPEEVVPVRQADKVAEGLHFAGLSEGPTLAFKDLAMQFLGRAIPFALTREGRQLTIVGATSGDTGSAAEHAFRGREGVEVFMLSPQGRMSRIQRAQMYSIDDPNVHNVAVAGVFDDCQNLVKAINADADFKTRHSIGAVNSINFGRILAQLVYYVWTWLRLTDEVEGANRASYFVDVAVPSGNFGNVYAAHLAKQMGLPLRRLIVATNENNVLDEFFSTGIYRPRSSEDTLATSSPSMDISRASNLERFLYDLLGSESFIKAWGELEANGSVDLSPELERVQDEFGFISGTSTHSDRLETIKAVYERSGEIIDPHTADAVAVALRVMEPGFPTLVMETAKADKFPETVEEAIGFAPEPTASLQEMLDAPQYVIEIDNSEAQLRALIEG